MSSQRFAPKFKEEAVRQVAERGYSVPDVAARLGVSARQALASASLLERERNRLPTARSLSAGTGAGLAFECHVGLAHSKDE